MTQCSFKSIVTCQLLTKIGLKHCNDSKAFIEYSNDMDDIYKNIE